MRKADLKTDGTVYYVMPTGPTQKGDDFAIRGVHSKMWGAMPAVLLDLDAANPHAAFEREKRTILARLLEGFKNYDGTDMVYVSSRRILAVKSEHDAMLVERAELRAQEERRRLTRANTAEEVVDRLRKKIESTGLMLDDTPLVVLSVTMQGLVEARLPHFFNVEAFEAMLDRLVNR